MRPLITPFTTKFIRTWPRRTRRMPDCMRRSFLFVIVALSLAFPVRAQTASNTIRLSVDLRESARRIFHARLVLPVKPGPLNLLYPKWIPGEHAPDGPITDVVGLKITANGKTVSWLRDNVDMYMFHIDVPAGVTSIEIAYDYLSPAGGEGFSAGPTADQVLSVLEWNLVALYPAGASPDSLTYQPSVHLPPGWKFATSLTVEKQDAGEVLFAPVSLT